MTERQADILIVDDTPANLRLLSQVLGENGYHVRPVPSGALALGAATLAPPDLILLDVKMPGLSGYEVCERLKEDERTRDVPVLFISAMDETRDKVQAFAVGGVDYITKPFQAEEVLARVETHLTMARLRRRLQEVNADLERKMAELARANAESEQRRQVAEGMRDILAMLNSDQPLRQVLGAIAQQGVRLLAARWSAVFRWQGDERVLCVEATCGLPGDLLPPEAAAFVDARAPEALRSGAPFVCPGRPGAEGAPAQGAALGVPLLIKGDLYGCLAFYYGEPRAVPAEHLVLAQSYAEHAALAIGNARLRAQGEATAVVAERSRLGRELHDSVTQTLFSATLIAEVLPQIWGRSPADAQRRVDELRRLTRGALAEMRTLLVELRPSALVDTPLGDLLKQLAEACVGRSGIDVACQVTIQRPEAGPPVALPPDVQIALYRIAQEALNNVAKHSGAGAAVVQFTGTCTGTMPNALELVIRDDGRGFDPGPAPADHFGLRIMRERAETIGAALSIDSRPGQGTCITVRWDGALPRCENRQPPAVPPPAQLPPA